LCDGAKEDLSLTCPGDDDNRNSDLREEETGGETGGDWGVIKDRWQRPGARFAFILADEHCAIFPEYGFYLNRMSRKMKMRKQNGNKMEKY
jgi:hypothetical protein